MQVLLIHQAFVAPSEAGGTRHYELARYCVEHGHDFTIVASHLSYLSGQSIVDDEKLIVEQDLDGIRVLCTYAFPSLHRSFIWRIISFLSFMLSSVWAGLRAGKVDVVMGTSPPIFQAISAWLISFLRRRPFLLEIRDLWPDFAVDMGVLKNPVLISLARWLERFLYARATAIVVNSPAYHTDLLQKGVPAHKLHFIPNGVDVQMFDPADDGADFRRRVQGEDQFLITYTGTLGAANDIQTILRAAQRLQHEPAIRFLLVGDGKERRNLETTSTDMGLTNVSFLGTLPKNQMPRVLAAADACVATLMNIPMFKHTYPNKVFDYMAAGRPTLLAIDGVIRDVVEAAKGGIFVQPGDDAALADAALRLYNNPQQTKAMGQSARAYVVSHFDRRQQAVQFLDLLESIVTDGHS